MSPQALSRRALLGGALGFLSLAACRSGGGITSLHEPAMSEHWSGKLFGRPPAARLVKRAPGFVPMRSTEPFFRKWHPTSTWEYWPSPTQHATHTEIFEDPSGEKVGVFRGMPNAALDPGSWKAAGPTPTGILEFHKLGRPETYRVFMLPGAIWVASWGVVSLRLSGRFRSEAGFPEAGAGPKPSALYVEELQVSSTSDIAFSSTVLYAAQQVRGITVATYAAPPGAPVPTTLDIVYPSSDLARDAAQDLSRLRAVSKSDSSSVAERFFRDATIASEERALVLRSTLPYATLVEWTRAS